MEIHISKQKSNAFIVFYKQDDLFFTHKVSIPEDFLVIDEELLRFSMVNSPFAFTDPVNVIGIAVSSEFANHMSATFGASIVCDRDNSPPPPQPRHKAGKDPIYLGFSGGFDSMAAKAILPAEQVRCISIDFGGYFQREADFFRTLDTQVITWDVRGERLNSFRKINERANWKFMLSPLTLLRGKRPNIMIGTGTVLDSSPFWTNPIKKREPIYYVDGGYGVGVSLVHSVGGLSEHMSAKIVWQTYGSDLFMRSLHSLALPTSLKIYTKKCLFATIQNDPNLISKRDITQKYVLGRAFADDITCLYFCWKFGVEWVKEFYADNVPDNLRVYDMSFFEKLNTNNLMLLDPELRAYVANKIMSYDIEPYTEYDYINLGLVREQLISQNFT